MLSISGKIRMQYFVAPPREPSLPKRKETSLKGRKAMVFKKACPVLDILPRIRRGKRQGFDFMPTVSREKRMQGKQGRSV